ncbi:site-specific DNA-methyltransferase [Ureaplasma urealyticum]|uniref:site-specific DNA-methyltransferase n=1 Tax=Ureaplasma urealyticum TaxID=2130 RepID=UPI001146ACF5|nr:site-specific DNA-methyltransferase [Ureaplasma urealyticum]
MYIDPPYNTEASKTDGNNFSEKDDITASKFIYRDKFSRNGWLNMMNERLKLAKNLLKNDGVIFVSIDDSEQAYLKVLMDEIFGEENFICSFIWERTNHTNQGNNGKKIFRNSEYIHTYSKNINSINYINEGDKKEFDTAPLKNNSNKEILIKFDKNQIFVKEKNQLNDKPLEFFIRSRWTQNRIDQELFLGTKFILTNQKDQIIRVKYSDNKKGFLIPKALLNTSKLYLEKYFKSTTEHGTKELNDILENNNFSYPKPKELICYLLEIIQNKNARVLDFFAGSGTTGHAVLELNKEDGGNRTFTLVTNNENQIGTNVCYERLYRINNGVGTKNEADFDWINKNEAYLNNLNVYDLKYFDTNPIKIDNNEIKEAFTKMLVDFNNTSQSSLFENKQRELLINLSTLKPIEKKE